MRVDDRRAVRIVAMLARPCPAARLLAPVAGLALTLALVAALSIAPSARAAIDPAEETLPAGAPRVVLAFLPLPDEVPKDVPAEPPLVFRPILERLDARSSLAIALSSAAQGQYDQAQALLDIGQGTRVSLSTYRPKRPPDLALVRDGQRGGVLRGWLEQVARADRVPARLRPGLLGSLVPGGAAYAGVRGRSQREAIVAANGSGRIGEVSIGRAGDVASRARDLLRRHRLVVAGLPLGARGDRALDRLIADRAPGDLLIVMQTPPDQSGAQLLPVGVGGLRGRAGALTSSTTHLRGIVAGIDVLPTVLEHLGVAVPSDVKGQPMRVEGQRDAAGLESLADRLRVVLPRRLPALWTLLGAWVVVLLAAALVADRRGMRWAMRIGSLAVLWTPAALLATAALAPARSVELGLLSLIAMALGVLTDRLIGWPRGAAVPAFVGLAVYAVDLAMGSPLIIRSLLGPNPLYGSRFYGLGNELEASLTALLVIGLGAALYGRGRSRRAAAAFALGGAALGLVMGAGRLGADVGGIFTVAGGAATAALLMLPGGVTRRALALAIVAPVVGLAALAAIDLATGGDAHFTRTILHADGSGALADVVQRRFELAWRALTRGFMPFAALVALLAIALGIKRRAFVLAPVDADPALRAALGGAVGAGIVGALTNDSGPVLLLFATFLGTCLVIYLRGDARLARR